MLQTVIFDMDGVIVDTEPVHYYAYHQLFNELNINVTDSLYHSFTGASTKNVFEKLKQQFQLKEEVAYLVRRKRDLFNIAFDTKPDLFLISGVEALIKHLHQHKVQIIVASSASKETINRVFTRFNLHPYFSHIVSGEDFEKSKPNPQIFIHAHQLSGVQAKHCIVIEDSFNGVQAAVDAGLFCIGYAGGDNAKTQDLHNAQYIVKDFAALNYNKITELITQ